MWRLSMISLLLATESYSIIVDSEGFSRCNFWWDIKIQNESVYEEPKAPPAPAVDAADINISVRLHVFWKNGPFSTGLIGGIDEWITEQSIHPSQSLPLSLIGMNVVKHIKFMLYFPASFNSITNKTKLYASYRNLGSITFLNESEWKKLALETVQIDNTYAGSINLAPNQFCSQAAVLKTSDNYVEFELSDISCPTNFRQHCPRQYWTRLCAKRFRQGDILKFNYTHGNITVKLRDSSYHQLFQSNKNIDNFTIPDNDYYTMILESHSPANITYSIMYKCTPIEKYINELMELDFNTSYINVFLSDVRLKPVKYGRFEFVIQSPVSSGQLIMIKFLDSSFVLEYLWIYIMEAFGAEIQIKNESPPCEQQRKRLENDSIVALYHLEELRCNLYNSKNPFGKQFNRTRINIIMADGKITTLYIPSSKVLGSNHSLYCDEAKLCVWDTTPSKANSPGLIPTTTDTVTSIERRSTSVLTTTKSITTSAKLQATNIIFTKSSVALRPTTKSVITESKLILGFFDEVNLNYFDVEQWVRINAATTVTHSCIGKRIIKVTILINDLNRQSRDLVLLQSQLRSGQLYIKDYPICFMNMVDSYDCNEKVENLCHPQKIRFKTWDIILFAFSGILGIVNIIFAIWLWHCCRQ